MLRDNQVSVITLLTLILLAMPANLGCLPITSSRLSEPIGTAISEPDLEPSAVLDPYSVGFDVYRTDDAFEGYNLFVLGQLVRATGEPNTTLVVMDMDGNIVADKYLGSGPVFNTFAKFIDPLTVLVGTPDGVALWNLTDDTMDYLGFRSHHEYEYNPNDDTIFTLNRVDLEIEGDYYRFDRIDEKNLTGDVVWSLSTTDFISHTWWCPFSDTAGGYPDITHSNTIFYDTEEDMIFYNSRNTNTFFKIDHSTGQVIWGLGEYGNFSLFDRFGSPKDSLFYHAHSVERVDDDTFILFDNDYHDQESTGPNSRILEITINETDMTAHESWSWSASAQYWSPGWGDADRLPGGNRIGTFGYWHASASDVSASIIEVNQFGTVVWQLDLPETADYLYGVYRSERFRYTPILSSPDDTYLRTGSSVNITWDAWYNYRTKQCINGSYVLYLDDSEIENGSFAYDKFWRPTPLDFDFGVLGEGTHNVTLEIFNDLGQKTHDSMNVSIGDYYFVREGPTSIELGQANSSVVWSGFTTLPLTIDLRINDSIILNELWDGADITVDLNTIGIGNHNIVFTMLNGTVPIFIDSLVVTVYPSAQPIIDTSNIDASIYWNTSVVLQWNLFDHTPRYWKLLVNDAVYILQDWTEQSESIIWDLPVFDEGVYNITLVAYDWALQTSSHTTIMTILPPDLPVIALTPYPTVIKWGSEDATLNWSVHGVTSWKLWKNNQLVDSANLTSVFIEHSIDDWALWTPGSYNMTLQVENDDGTQAISTTIVQIVVDYGDPYADAVIISRSSWYSSGENAIGAPDGSTASIFYDYGNGYVTLDMGFDEEIVDGEGADFTVIASGNYSVTVTESLDTQFSFLGFASGNSSFDLSAFELESVRYVRIEYSTGNFIELDAIEAHNYNLPMSDENRPVIQGLCNLTVSVNTTVTLNWTGYDLTPWRYSILVNGAEVESGAWDGSDINYSFSSLTPGTWNVTLVLTDIFLNTASHSTLVTVIDTTLPGTTLLVIVVAISGVVIATSTIYFLKVRKPSAT
ncbi:MAG: aryl-sulfate sulfotransferase [Candidatus Thorarchaeota archaeon]